MKAGTLIVYEVCGAFFFTVGVLRGPDFSAGLMVGLSLGFFALATRERDQWPSWFQSFSFAFSGLTFLVGGLLSHGRSWSPVLMTFGPGFLIMALCYFIKRRHLTRA